MEKGFFHPTRGYWQTTNTPPQSVLDSYPEGTIEVTLKPSATHQWVDGAWADVPLTTEQVAERLAQARASMVISPLQGILTLGETEWGKVLAFRDGVDADGEPLATWAQKVIINSALDWRRTSQNIAFFGFLLDYTDEQMDTLFIAAAQVSA